MDITPALTLGARPAAPASLASGKPVQRRIEPPGYMKLCAGLYLLSPLPPTGILALEYILLCRFSGTDLIKLFGCLLVC
ncbi:MAG: hypothetical protein JXB30_04300 [Anaerolineae bacterium]|nr:hypothetical protein [Anaerolineae bacterium]